MLSERLALLVSLDARSAVGGLEKVGRTADRELSKVDGGSARMAKGFQRAGVGMLSTGGLLTAGLFKIAQKSETAALSTHKLENSIANNAKMAGHSVDEFTSLADAIAGKTAADNDDIVAGQAVLAQFKLEAEQVKELTPLVVDLARKKGIDLASAATLAAKAVNGNSGALARQGIIVDETAFKTDAYKATVEGLRDSVGGFAEQEGKTFAGSLERAKNQLGDLAEGVGVGAVDAFTSLLNPVTKLASKLKDTDPAVQSLVGRLATFGAVGLTAAGGLTFAIGKLIQMRDTLAPLGGRLRTAEGGLTRLGRTAAALPIAAVAVSLAQMGREMNNNAVHVDVLEKKMANLTDANEKQLAAQLFAAEALGGFDEIVRQTADSNVLLAERTVDLAEKYGVSSDAIARARDILEEKRHSDQQGAKDQEAYSEEVDTATGATDELADATGGLTKKLDEEEEALQGVLDATLAQFDSNIGYRQSVDNVQDSMAELVETQKEHGRNSEEYRDKLLDTESALLDQADAAVRLYDDTVKAAGGTLSAKDKTAIYRNELVRLRDSLKPGSPLRAALDQYINKLNSIPTSITTTIRPVISGARASQLLTGTRASGGPVAPGGTYLVGERGPELLSMGSDSGYVHANGTSGATSETLQPIQLYLDSQVLVDALVRQGDRNGPLPIKVR